MLVLITDGCGNNSFGYGTFSILYVAIDVVTVTSLGTCYIKYQQCLGKVFARIYQQLPKKK